MEKLKAHKFKSLNSGKAENVEDFFNQMIKPQFQNVEDIKRMHKTLLEYIEHPNATLFLRLYGSAPKDKYDQLRRGFLTQYPDSSKMVFCDNTFSMLFTGLKIAGHTVDAKQLLDFFNQEKLICSFGLTSSEKELSFYTTQKAIRVPINSKGYYQAHIKPTGYGYSDICDKNLMKIFTKPERAEWNQESKIRIADKNLVDTQKTLLKAHFLRLVHPLNSFLVPKVKHLNYDGKNIGEEIELIMHVKNYLEKEFPQEYKEFEAITLSHTFKSSDTSLKNIEWFDKPINDKKCSAKLKKNSNSSNKKISPDFEVEEQLESQLLGWLKSIGMQAYTEILCPSIISKTDITVVEISNNFPQFAKYSEASKKSRLSSSKSIHKYGLTHEALQFIIDSKSTAESTRTKASELQKSL